MTDSLQILAVVLLFAAVFTCFIAVLAKRKRPDDNVLDWLDEFSVESYRPMERLLNEADYEFLASQPGYHPCIARELRVEHRRIFRMYLRSLTRDFNKLVYLARLAMVSSSEDRPDFARAIFRLRIRFYWSVAGAEIRLALAPLPVGSIDAKRLIGSLTLVRDNIDQMVLQHTA